MDVVRQDADRVRDRHGRLLCPGGCGQRQADQERRRRTQDSPPAGFKVSGWHAGRTGESPRSRIAERLFTAAAPTVIFRAGSDPGGSHLTPGQAPASRSALIAAFAAIYIVWGSTYLAIRFAIETMPPFLMAGMRFLAAGSLLYGWAVLRHGARPARAHWVTAAVTGALLLLCGNGALVWAEQRVPSGVAALLVATTPCWMVLADWLRPGGVRPTKRTVAGLLLGLAGIALLAGPERLAGGAPVDLVGALVLMFGSLTWAVGSIYSRHARFATSPGLAAGMQMLAGGTMLVTLGLLTNELPRLHPAALSSKSLLALAYLVTFGSLIGYSAYTWLLRHATPARVSTYAYVNPVVAVMLGWALAGEALTPRMGVAALIIVGGVALITLTKQPRSGPGRQPDPDGGGSLPA